MIRKPVGLTAPYRRDDDDDIQDYKKPWVGLTQTERAEFVKVLERGNFLVAIDKIEEVLRRKNHA